MSPLMQRAEASRPLCHCLGIAIILAPGARTAHGRLSLLWQPGSSFRAVEESVHELSCQKLRTLNAGGSLQLGRRHRT